MNPPDLLLFAAFGGDWAAYENELHRIFIAEIARGGLAFRGVRVNCRRLPEAAGRWASFWHLVQEGRAEDHRTPDLRRCERIRWVRWMIENAPTHAEIDEWQNTRGTEVNTLLWYREEYLVILAQRHGYCLLKTAYRTEKSGRIRQLQQTARYLRPGRWRGTLKRLKPLQREPGRPRMLVLHMAGETSLICRRKVEMSRKADLGEGTRRILSIERVNRAHCCGGMPDRWCAKSVGS